VRPRLAHLAAIAFAAPLLGSHSALGASQHISSELFAEGYSVPAADGSALSRRRLVDDLRLSVFELMPGSADPYYRGPRLSLELDLRIDTDFAVRRAESDPDLAASYSPGTTPLAFDAVIAFVDAQGFWNGALDARGGRQIRLDAIGFTAFDGLEMRLHLPLGLSIAPFLGYEVRGGDLLGYDAFELDGVDSGGRHDMETDRYTSRTDPDPRLAFGAEVEFAPSAWLDAAAAYRVVGLSEQIADERVGGRIDAGKGPVRAHVRAVWSPILDRRDDFAAAAAEGTAVNEADAELTVTPVSFLSVTAEYHLFRPIFEADSIFNVFDLEPRRDLGGRAGWEITKSTAVSAWGFARLSDGSEGVDGASSDALLAGAGGGAGATYRNLRRNASIRVTASREWGEDLVGAEVGGGQGFADNRLWVTLRGSYWHIDDSISSYLAGDILGYAVSLKVKLLEGAAVVGEFENYYGGDRAPRFEALALLQLDLWR
jgi:hypothetical protein